MLLARDPDGYARLSTVLADAHLEGGEKGKPVFTLDALARAAGDHWLVLSGCRKGAVPAALMEAGPRAASREVGRLVEAFGRANVALELWDHGDPLDTARNDALARLAVEWGVDAVATNNVHYATPAGFRLATTLAAVRARRPLAELEGWLPSAPAACLRSAAEQARRFARWPGVVERAAELGRACAFDLRLVAPRLPDFPVPAGMDEQGYLRQLVTEGATARYGPPGAERVPGAWKQIEHELAVIGQLGFAGYFLVVWDIAQVCRRLDIYCQGRGSAANSAVCYALGVTNVDAVDLGLLFERFLSPARDGPPDIDVDIESGRREEVIQYVYERYGRRHAAQVANVITYRPRSAVRDVGKAFGFTPEQVDAWAAGIDAGHGRGRLVGRRGARRCPRPRAAGVPPLVAELAAEVLDRPRHLGIHSAGMVLCDRPVVEVCPVEWGRMPGRSVLQWDKDDCAAIGLVKFDLLGLGMLEALHRMVDLVRAFHGVEVDLGQLPQEPAVYDLLCRADTVGVFQVESRAQMGTLPRVAPRTFYDIAIEVALIRPGPIQGHAVNPYIRRRRGEEEVTYLHPLLEPILERTLGVPLFQEQLMEMAVAIAGFSAADADELRQAMAAKRSAARMEKMRARLFDGMAARGVTGAVADQVFDALAAFANFGFPESHSVSFAHLVYSSAWLKLHYPAAFTAGLLNSQPMGFWSPQSLVADARRHGVRVRRPHVNRSEVGASLEARGDPVRRCCASGWGRCAGWATPRRSASWPAAPGPAARTWCGGRGRPRPSSRRWPPPARSTPRCPGAGGRGTGRGAGTTASRRRLVWAAGRGGPGHAGPPARGGGGGRGAAAARAQPLRLGGRRPVGAGAGARAHGHASRPGAARGHGRADGARARGVRRRRAGLGGRRGDAPPASRDGPGRGLRQPGGRDGPRERGLLPRRLGPLEARGPPRARAADPRAGAQGAGGGQLRRRAGGGAGGGDGGAGEPGLPLAAGRRSRHAVGAVLHPSPGRLDDVRAREHSMIRVSVFYPATEGATFDHDYYREKHVPLVVRTWTPVSAEIDKGVDGPHVAAVHMTFESLDALSQAMAAEGTADVLADVANYTTITPVLQTSEIVG